MRSIPCDLQSYASSTIRHEQRPDQRLGEENATYPNGFRAMAKPVARQEYSVMQLPAWQLNSPKSLHRRRVRHLPRKFSGEATQLALSPCEIAGPFLIP